MQIIADAISFLIIAAFPFFGGWMANDAKPEDLWIAVGGTAGGWCILMVFYLILG